MSPDLSFGQSVPSSTVPFLGALDSLFSLGCVSVEAEGSAVCSLVSVEDFLLRAVLVVLVCATFNSLPPLSAAPSAMAGYGGPYGEDLSLLALLLVHGSYITCGWGGTYRCVMARVGVGSGEKASLSCTLQARRYRLGVSLDGDGIPLVWRCRLEKPRVMGFVGVGLQPAL